MSKLSDALYDWYDTTDATDDEFIELFNAAVEDISDYDQTIYYMSDIDDILAGKMRFSPSDIIDRVVPEFSLSDKYFVVDNDHEEIYSFNELDDPSSPFDFDLIVDAIIDSNNSYGNDEILDILNQIEE